jgi:3-dehydroquinate dehydratase/shikimate dehydrogenase
MGVRQIPFMNLYDTLTDIAIIADAGLQPGPGRTELNPAFFRDEMIIADFSRLPLETNFSREAGERGCRVIDPKELGYDYLSALFKAVVGKELDRGGYDRVLEEMGV